MCGISSAVTGVGRVGRVPRVRRGGVREQRVARRVEAAGGTCRPPARGSLPPEYDRQRQPGHDVGVERLHVGRVVREAGVVLLGRLLVGGGADQPGQRIAHRLVALRLAVARAVGVVALSCETWSTIATGSTNERSGLSISTPSSSNVSSVSAPRDAVVLRRLAAFVPERQRDALAARNAAQRVLELVQVDPVPGREQHRAVLAVAAPPGVGIGARTAERLAVEAAEHEERVGIVRRQLLDALPRAHQRLELGLVAAVVVGLDVGERTALPGGGRTHQWYLRRTGYNLV